MGPFHHSANHSKFVHSTTAALCCVTYVDTRTIVKVASSLQFTYIKLFLLFDRIKTNGSTEFPGDNFIAYIFSEMDLSNFGWKTRHEHVGWFADAIWELCGVGINVRRGRACFADWPKRSRRQQKSGRECAYFRVKYERRVVEAQYPEGSVKV